MLTVKNTEKKVKIRETGSRKISRSRAGSAALLIFLIITGVNYRILTRKKK